MKTHRNLLGRHRRGGFTLLEIMLVVVILGILVTMATVKIQGNAEKARVTAAKSEIDGALRTALGLYELDNACYPTTEQGLKALVEKPAGDPAPQKWRPYLEKKTVPKDPWGRDYLYVCPGTHNPEGFDLSSLGKDGIESADDITNW
ncbi:MAG: type II secretion system major pseudopilin GspG [Verrucomicrobiae bacterium]|nr:type II secretion system major pseudopilin GspG [Verrucomicrobiae bacterium]